MLKAQKHIILLTAILLWSCVSVRANEVTVAFVNGAPQGILWHDKDNWTMYVSPYMVVNADRFTKHYYAGSQRIASKIGVGDFNNLYDASKASVTAGQKDYAEKLNLITQSRNDYYAALGIPPGPPTAKGIYGEAEYSGKYGEYVIEPLGDYSVPTGWPMKPYKRPYGGTPGPPVMYEKPSDPEDEGAGYGYSNGMNQQERDLFFYHSDHLGSTNYITDRNGNVIQFVCYKPYGEALVDEHNTSYEQPWKFNGKELDSETGLYYYGARYYEPVLAMWYGEDALAEKKTNNSPYLYCIANPIKYIDPDGNDEYKIAPNGNVEVVQNKQFDIIHIINENGDIIQSSERMDYQTLKFKSYKKDGNTISSFTFRGDKLGDDLFSLITYNSDVEWGRFEMGKASDRGLNVICTSGLPNEDAASANLWSDRYYNHSIRKHIHSHPYNSTNASYYPSGLFDEGSGDIQFARYIETYCIAHKLLIPKFYIFLPYENRFIPFSGNSQKGDFSKKIR